MSNPHSLHHRPAHQPTSSAVTSPNYHFIVTTTLHSSGSLQGTRAFRFQKSAIWAKECKYTTGVLLLTFQRLLDLDINGPYPDASVVVTLTGYTTITYTTHVRKSHSSKITLLYSDMSTSRRTAYTVTITLIGIILSLKNKNMRPARMFSTMT